jgi:hypothetical protein
VEVRLMRQSELNKLKSRIEALEQQVSELRTAAGAGTHARNWRSAMGMFGDDPIMKEILDEALKYREADRERARRRFARSDRAKNGRRSKATAGQK